ncbi:MAG: XrtA/PEP-CTERM system TPR-repeat protein PrsT [Betaproteobacteria bacterium]
MKSLHRKTLLAALLTSVLLTACSNQSPEQQLQSAKEFIQKSDNRSAQIQLKNALQKNPDLAEARFLLGKLLLDQGDAAGAEIEFRKALAAKHPESVVVPELALSMLQLDQSRKLVDQFGNARLDRPSAVASLQTSLALAQSRLGNSEAAEAALKAALVADPNHVPALMLQVRQKVAARDVGGALLAMDDILAKAPGNAEAWKLKGDTLLYAKGKPDDALAAYRKSTEVNPKFELGHLAVLAILLQRNEIDEASAELEKLRKFAPKTFEFKYAEAQLAYRKNDFKKAKELAAELLRLAANNPRILQLAGLLELQTNSLAQAEIYLTRAVQGEPQSALSQRLLITTYLRSGQSAKALDALKGIASKDRLDPKFFELAADVYMQNGDAKSAEEYLGKALKADPTNIATQTALAITQFASGRNDISAFNELERIAESTSAINADLALVSAHLQRGNSTKALEAVAKLEAKQPGNPMAATMRGRIQLAQKDTSAARKSFEQALVIDPLYFQAASSLAAMDMADKKPADAKQRFERLLAKDPRHGQALLALAELAAVQGAGKEEVAGLLTKAVDANPTDVAPRLLLIELHLRNKDTKLALTAAQNAVVAVPGSLELLDALGRTQQETGDLNQATATFNKLIEAQPLSPQALLRLATVQRDSKNTVSAEKSLRKALELQPDFLDAQRSLIILNLEAKKFQEALMVARLVQKQRPNEAIGFMFEGDSQSAQEDWDSAKAAYRAGLKVVETTELALKLHAATEQSGKAAEADQFASIWMKSHPADAQFLFYLGDVALVRKDYSAAEKEYLAVIQLQPNNALALNNLAWIGQQLHRDNAIAYAEKANQLAPNQPALMDTWAMLLSEKGQHTKAIELQSKALLAQPANTGFRLNLAKLYLAAGEKAKARLELDALAKQGPTASENAEIASLLKTL